MGNYKVDSPKAEEFICHDEILDTLAYAQAHRNDTAWSVPSSKRHVPARA